MTAYRFSSSLFLGTFLALALGVSFAALQYRQANVKAIEQEIRGTLQSINNVKVSHVAHWREGVLADASLLMADMKLISPIERVAAGSGSDSDRGLVKEWLEFLLKQHRYVTALIADAQGQVLIAAGEHHAGSEHYKQLVTQALEIKRASLTDLHEDTGLVRLHMGLTIPIENQQGRANSVLLLGIDPEQGLYRILEWWPVDRKSAETLLLQQDAGAFIYVSQSRDLNISLKSQRVPVTDEKRAGVRALNSRSGYADGLDYRGQQVMAVARKVPDSSWSIVTKIDRREMDARSTGRGYLLAYTTVALIVALGVGLAFLWRLIKKAGEKPLRETRALLETTVQSSPAAMIAIDQKRRVMLWNPAAERLFGWSAAEIMNRPLPRSPKTASSSSDELCDFLLRETVVDQAVVRYRKDGTPVPVKVSSAPIYSDQGEVMGTMAICIDATEQWKAENALRESERQFRELVEGAPEGIIMQTGTRFRYLNRAALEILGAPDADALLGHPIVGRVHPDFWEIVQQRLQSVNEGQNTAPLAEMKYLRLDGTPIDVEVCSIPSCYLGEPGAIVFFRDITSRKIAEQKRTMLEEQFRQSQKMESIGRLAGNVAHEFNNHLTVINGYSQVLCDDPGVDANIRRMLVEIRHAGERSVNLTKQLLAFSGKQLMEPKVVGLNDVIRDSEQMFRTLVGEDIGLHLILEPGLSPILADSSQLNRVLMNLLVNARDAMQEGGNLIIETANVKVEEAHVAHHSGMKPGPHTTLTVTDTGLGMDEETQKHIFEPFFTTESETGTGLRLAMVFGIVHQMNGSICVYSEPQKGTAFKLYFPATSETREVENKAGASGEKIRKGSERILLAEDSEQLRKFAIAVLSGAGYRVLEAANGLEALNIYEEERTNGEIELVITDVVMPEMSGKQLVEALWKKNSGLPVLYISGHTAAGIERFGILDPHVRYLPKPFGPTGLLKKIGEILDGRINNPGRILVVDDEIPVRRFLGTILEAGGYEVREASNGCEAITHLEQAPADVVITDLVMPEQEGIATIGIIRTRWPEIKVIAISGAYGGQFLKNARLMGARRALLKPVSAQELLTAVNDVLQKAFDL